MRAFVSSMTMRKLILIVIAIALGTCAWADTSTPAASPAKTVKVGLYFEAPFVMKTKTGDGGYAIELWDQIAASQGWQSEYVTANTVPELIAMTRNDKIDIAVTDMFITADRVKQVDFSHPYFDSGLQIMIDEDRHPGMLDLLNGLASSGHLRIFAIGGILIIVATLILTYIDRRFDPHFHKEWFSGLAISFYHIMSATFTGKSEHRNLITGPLGYVAAAIWVAAGITIVAYITSSITSVMTANQIRSQINGPEDLPGKTVGTILGEQGKLTAEVRTWTRRCSTISMTRCRRWCSARSQPSFMTRQSCATTTTRIPSCRSPRSVRFSSRKNMDSRCR